MSDYKTVFSGSAIGFNQEGEICNTYGIFAAHSEAEAIGLVTIRYRDQWGAEPVRVDLTKQSIPDLRQLAYISGAVSEAIEVTTLRTESEMPMGDPLFRDTQWMWLKLIEAYERETGQTVGAIEVVHGEVKERKQLEIVFQGRFLSPLEGVAFELALDETPNL